MTGAAAMTDKPYVPRKGHFRFKRINDVKSLEAARVMLEDCLINEWTLDRTLRWGEEMWDLRREADLSNPDSWHAACAIGGSFLILATREVADTPGT